MSKNTDANDIISTEPLVGELLPKTVTVASIYRDYRTKKELYKSQKKTKDKKGGRAKSKKESALELYDNCFSNFNLFPSNSYDPFLREESRLREGNVIPIKLELNLYDESGMFFGTKYERNFFVGKPTNEDGHILVIGSPGSGKTEAVVKPTIMTWRGVQIIIDVKGDLHKHWLRVNKHTGKKVKVFSPGAPKGCSCSYDPYAPLRHGGADNVIGNARDLALALMPLLPSVKDPIWIKSAQNFLTGVIIYHFNMDVTFVETMVAVQLSSITSMIDEIMGDDDDAAKAYISKLHDVQDKVIGNIGMELSDLAALVTDPAIINILCTDGEPGQIDWDSLNTTREPFDIILEFPEANLERWEPLMRLMINQLIKSLEQRPQRTYKEGKEALPILVMLDEFPRLGKISAIKNGLATLRSRGVTFALFVQSLADLDEIYGSTTSRVISDICTYKVVLCVADATSQEYVSKLVGTIESTQRSVSANHDPYSGNVLGYSRNISETREPIIYPHEFLTQKDVVVISPHGGFCRVRKTLFVDNEEVFLRSQLLQNRDYMAQNPITYTYNP